MAVHQCPRCELRFGAENEVADHLRSEHDMDPNELERFRYGGEKQQAPLYPDLVERDPHDGD